MTAHALVSARTDRRPDPRGLFAMAGIALAVSGCSNEPFRPPPGFESPSPGVVVNLAPGERMTVSASEVRGALEIPSASETQSYVFIVHDGRSSPGGPVDVQFDVTRIPSAFSETPASDVRASTVGRSVPVGSPSRAVEDPFEGWFSEGETRFRARVSSDLARSAARAARPRAASYGGPGVRASVGASVPAEGQLIEFGSPVQVDGALATCSSTTRVTGRVRAVGPHFAIVEDTLVAGPFSQTDFDNLLAEIESVAYPVDSAYFGTPHDIDGNGRVLAFITGEVNRLGAAGFFTASDLAVAEDCPTSNEGEVLWLIAPDPMRLHGFDPIPTDLVRTRLAGVIVHELQHLIHLQRRVYEGGGDLTSADRPWVNEGMSHIAEEVAGFFVAGRRTGQNYGLEDLGTAGSFTSFSRYHLNDLRFMREYLQDTGNVPVLADGPVTRAQLQKARGFGYLFLRWLADQYAADGPAGLVGSVTEETFFQDLALGGPGLLQSSENVVAALAALGVNRTWEDLFDDYVGVPAVDDLVAPHIALDPVLGISSWNFPLAFENAGANGFDLDFPNGYPFQPKLILLRTIPFTGFSDQFELLPSTAVYLRLEGVFETPLSRVAVTGPKGVGFTSGSDVRITIIRTL